MDFITFIFFFIIFLFAGLFIAYNIILIKAQNRAKKSNEIKRSKEVEKSEEVNKNDYVFTAKKNYNKVDAYPSTFVVFDLETTGLSPITEQIIEIGAIKYVDGVEKSRFHTYVNPQRHIPEAASRINHIYDETVKDAPIINTALVDFIDFIGNNFLLAHNSDFDMSFIQTQANNLSIGTVSNKVIDTLSLARQYLRDLPNHKLVTIKKYFNIKVNSHNALDDCYVTAQLYLYCCNQNSQQNKYQYGVRVYKETNLNAEEESYLYKIIEIFQNAGFDKTELFLQQGNGYFLIYGNNNKIKIKLSGTLRYVLLNTPLSKINTELKCTEGSKNEGGENSTRIFIQSPEQLNDFKNLIIGK